MDDILNKLEMRFHPLMDLDDEYISQNKELLLERKEIRVLTYNLFLRPPPIKNNEDDWKDERLADFVNELQNYDVICLQEMFGTLTSRRQQMIKFANKSGLLFHVEVPSPSFFSKHIIDAGLLILSRFPIIESEFRPFKYTVLNCTLCQKGVLYAKIKIKDSHLIVFNNHLQATYFNITIDQWNLCIKTRLDHIAEAAIFIKDIITKRELNSSDTILYMGDFNVDAHKFENKIKKYRHLETYPLPNEYQILLERLNELFITNDLWMKKYEKHPFTYGVTGSESQPQYDTALVDKGDYNCEQTIDYMFEIFIDKKDEEEQGKNKPLKKRYDSIQPEEFLVKDRKYQQLSDHFGISFVLDYQEKEVI
jgi:endonuclease/exonuclease/phosphatase family metal-dependent hydrolase